MTHKHNAIQGNSPAINHSFVKIFHCERLKDDLVKLCHFAHKQYALYEK